MIRPEVVTVVFGGLSLLKVLVQVFGCLCVLFGLAGRLKAAVHELFWLDALATVWCCFAVTCKCLPKLFVVSCIHNVCWNCVAQCARFQSRVQPWPKNSL